MVDCKRERVWAEIDLDRLAQNVKNIKAAVPGRLMAVVKADAYGHGAAETAEVCLNSGADCLAVANIDEAESLRRKGINSPVLILGYTPPERFGDVIENNITQTVYSRKAAEELSEAALRAGRRCGVHIKLDTGMGRIGFPSDEKSIGDILEISRMPGISCEGIFTHFADADSRDKEYTVYQAKRFRYVTDSLEEKGLKLIKHCANSAAILDMPEELGFDMVRAGIILYGCYPSEEVKRSVDIRPVMSLKSHIAHVKLLRAGSYVSYGRTYRAKKDITLVTLPVGYADGYFRCFGNSARIIIKDSYCPVVGRVCMDQFMADASGVPDVRPGDEAILMGEQRGLEVSADELALLGNTISYELLCSISRRVPRVYTEGGSRKKIINYIERI